jgi:hypothetical protein
MMVFGEVVVVFLGVASLQRLICVLVHVVRVGCGGKLGGMQHISVSLLSRRGDISFHQTCMMLRRGRNSAMYMILENRGQDVLKHRCSYVPHYTVPTVACCGQIRIEFGHSGKCWCVAGSWRHCGCFLSPV